jgi:L-asparaginase
MIHPLQRAPQNLPPLVILACLLHTLWSPQSGAAQHEQTGELPTVVVLSTGGTIASVYDPERGGFAPALSGEDLVAAVPGITDLAHLEVEQISNIASTDMTPALWLAISRRSDVLLARADVAGVIVTHGTDTLEETAFFLDLTVTSDKPVILVGAQRAASDPDSDGPRNLGDAVRVAVSPAAVGMGTLVVMNGEINAAREVTKTHTMRVETFRSLEYGRLGTIDPDGVRFYRAPLRRQSIPVPPDGELGRVEIVSTYAGADGRLLRGLMAQGGMDGLIVEAAGVGNLAGALFDAIAEVREAGIPVVVSTRVTTGRTLPLYAGKGSGVSLGEIGCIFADNLSPQKARVMLLAALAAGPRQGGLEGYFSR